MTLLECTCLGLSHLNLDDVRIYKTNTVTPLFDYVVLATAQSARQLDAVVNNIEEEVYKNNYKVRGIEGKNGGTWVLIDLNDVLVNVFYKDERQKYGLDNMWRNLPTVEFDSLIENLKSK